VSQPISREAFKFLSDDETNVSDRFIHIEVGDYDGTLLECGGEDPPAYSLPFDRIPDKLTANEIMHWWVAATQEQRNQVLTFIEEYQG
jgi:hypothetical protein